MFSIREVDDVPMTIEVGLIIADIVTAYFPDAVRMEFEKVYTDYLLIKKKMYAGLLWEKGDRPSYIDSKGLVNKRRDNPLFLKKLFNRVLDLLMGWDSKAKKRQPKDVDKAIKLVQACQRSILLQERPMEDFVISKQWSKPAGDYKNRQPHVQLALKMIRREPGNAPAMGDRVPFVYVEATKKALAYERAEDPIWAREHNIAIDAQYYIERCLVRPFLRLFRFVLCPGMRKKEAYDRVFSRIFVGSHARVRKILTPTSGSIAQYLQILPRLPPEEEEEEEEMSEWNEAGYVEEEEEEEPALPRFRSSTLDKFFQKKRKRFH